MMAFREQLAVCPALQGSATHRPVDDFLHLYLWHAHVNDQQMPAFQDQPAVFPGLQGSAILPNNLMNTY